MEWHTDIHYLCERDRIESNCPAADLTGRQSEQAQFEFAERAGQEISIRRYR
jgi:hypothetical protein